MNVHTQLQHSFCMSVCFISSTWCVSSLTVSWFYLAKNCSLSLSLEAHYCKQLLRFIWLKLLSLSYWIFGFLSNKSFMLDFCCCWFYSSSKCSWKLKDKESFFYGLNIVRGLKFGFLHHMYNGRREREGIQC